MAALKGDQKLIAMDNLTIGDKLGNGHFGCVYKASLKLPDQDASIYVAVKTLQSSCKFQKLKVDFERYFDHLYSE